MTDEELITSTLDRYYTISFGSLSHSFVALHIDYPSDYQIKADDYFRIKDNFKEGYANTITTFSKNEKIFGVFVTDTGESSTDIVLRWFNKHKFQLTKELGDYIEKMDMSRGSKTLLIELLFDFEDKKSFSDSFLTSYFSDTYRDLVIIPKMSSVFKSLDYTKKPQKLLDDLSEIYNNDLEDHLTYVYTQFIEYYKKNYFVDIINGYIDSFDKTKNSSYLIDTFLDKHMGYECKELFEFASNKLNDWYSEEVLKNKVDNLLAQFVITLGKTNWRVTWVGHGEMTDIRFREIFKEENFSQLQYVTGYYDNWYENKIVERSEYYVKNSMI